MDLVMCTLKDVAMTAKIPVNVRSMLLSVIELRASSWGRTPGADPPTSTSAPTSSAPAADVPHVSLFLILLSLDSHCSFRSLEQSTMGQVE